MDRAKCGGYINHVLQKVVPAVVMERGGATKYWKILLSFQNKNQIWVKSMASKQDSTSFASELWFSS